MSVLNLKPFSLFSNAVRAKEIFTILARYGFHDLIELIEGLPPWLRKLVPQEAIPLTPWQRIKRTCEELGPTFVKFGQILSTRGDILPLPLIAELKQLRSHARPVPFEEIKIKNICSAGRFYCVYTSQCCSGAQQCTVNGCVSPDHDDHDD